jgi:predicted DNA binding CopG/RHH family protein
MSAMPEKKRKTEDTNGEEKKHPGRPKTLSPDLDKRHQLRCASKDFEAWKARATKLGFPNVSAWLRKCANDALKQPAR